MTRKGKATPRKKAEKTEHCEGLDQVREPPNSGRDAGTGWIKASLTMSDEVLEEEPLGVDRLIVVLSTMHRVLRRYSLDEAILVINAAAQVAYMSPVAPQDDLESFAYVVEQSLIPVPDYLEADCFGASDSCEAANGPILIITDQDFMWQPGPSAASSGPVLEVQLARQAIQLNLWLRADPWAEKRGEFMLATYSLALRSFREGRDAQSLDFPMGSDERALLLRWSEGKKVDRPPVPIADRIRSYGARTAIVVNSLAYTYDDLNRISDNIAAGALRAGIGTCPRVCVLMDKSIELVCSYLAVLKLGGCYVPLDPTYPDDRLLYIMQDTDSTMVFTSLEYEERIPLQQHRVVVGAAVKESKTIDLPSVQFCPKQSAYIIYTSGSTGRPNGVEVPYESLVDVAEWYGDFFDLRPGTRTSWMSSPAFDASVMELWGGLLSGSVVFLPNEDARLSASALQAWVHEHRIEVLFVPTPLAQQLLALDWSRETSLRSMATGGDRLVVYPRCGLPFRIYNLYGPTESTVVATAGHIRPNASGEIQLPDIGLPIANREVYILNDRLQLSPYGTTGELCIGGLGLAVGYVGNGNLTAARFCQAAISPGGTIYRTGDYARWRPDGRIEFSGRGDGQVKIRGFRIELGEIEAVIRENDVVQDCVVSTYKAPSGSDQVCAYIVPTGSQSETDSSTRYDLIHRSLCARLPAYMVPSSVVELDSIPLTLSGKIDYGRLPLPLETQVGESGGDDFSVSAGTEKDVARVWEEVLRIGSIGRDSNFFALGGDSLLAAHVIDRLRRECSLVSSISSLLRCPRLKDFTQHCTTLGQHDERDQPEPMPGQLQPSSPRRHLNDVQKAIWIRDHEISKLPVSNLPFLFVLQGSVDAALMRRCLGVLLLRHQALRGTVAIEEGELVHVPQDEPPTPFFELSLPSGRDIFTFMSEKAAERFDLTRELPFKAVWVRTDESTVYFLIVFHHIAVDGWSTGILFEELAALYSAGGESQSATRDASVSSDSLVETGSDALGASDHLDYWVEALTGITRTIDIPLDFPRPPVRSFAGDTFLETLDQDLCRQLQEFAKNAQTTNHTALLAVFSILLHSYSGQEDIIVGTPVLRRRFPDDAALVGCFADVLPIRSRADWSHSFIQTVDDMKETVFEALDHQHVSSNAIARHLGAAPTLSTNPLAQVVFSYLEESMLALKLSQTSVAARSLGEIPTGCSKFDITLTAKEREESILLEFEYNTDVFERATISGFARHFLHLLKQCLSDPHQSIDCLRLMDQLDEAFIDGWNSDTIPYAEHGLHEYFAKSVSRLPDAPAIVSGNRVLTYRELDSESGRFADGLRCLGVTPGSMVALMQNRSPDLLVSILGILKVGAAYVPIDPAYPQKRIDFLVKDSNSVLVVTDRQSRHLLGRSETPILEVEDVPTQRPFECECEPVDPASPSYVIYTSGSTGVPKGVLISHKSVSALIAWAFHTYSPGDLSGVLASTSVCFDLSVFELFVTLAAGGTIILAENAFSIPELPPGTSVSLLNTVPSVARVLVGEGLIPASVRVVNIAGEPLDRALVDRLYGLHNVERVYNLYGPSEDTTYSTWELVDRTESATPTIGRPIPNTQAYVCDQRGRVLPPGSIGELYLAGAGLALGYLNQESLTSERFFEHKQIGRRTYRTGDLVRLRHDGRLEFRGRLDRQVKVRGYRIELGEIGTAADRIPGIHKSVAVVHGANETAQIILYVTPPPVGVQAAQEILSHLRLNLPGYMVPDRIVPLASFPLTHNGKVDYKLLPEPEPSPGNEAAVASNSGPTESVVEAVWCDVLQVNSVSASSSFFGLGGDSILAAKAAARISRLLDVDVTMISLFAHPGFDDLCAHIRSQIGNSFPKLSPTVPTGKGCVVPLTRAQYRIWMQWSMDPDSSEYNLFNIVELDGALEAERLKACVASTVQRHEVFRQRIVFDGKDPLVEIVNDEPLAFSYVEGPLTKGQVDEVVREITQSPFDLSVAPLARFLLAKVDNGRHIFVCCMHHIIADGISLSVLLEEISERYNRPSWAGCAVDIEPRIDYSDYARWEVAVQSSERFSRDIQYWRSRLQDHLSHPPLPFANGRGVHERNQGVLVERQLDATVVGGLRRLAAQNSATLFAVLLAALKAVLCRLSGSENICVGTPVSTRDMPGLENVVGVFLNTLALASEVDPLSVFSDVVAQEKEATTEALAHAGVPFERVVADLQPDRSQGRTPFFEVMLNYLPNTEAALTLDGILASTLSVERVDAKFPLTIYAHDDPSSGEIRFEIACQASAFDEGFPEEFAEIFLQFLAAAADNPLMRVGQYALENQKCPVFHKADEEEAQSPVWLAVLEQEVSRPDAVAVADRSVCYSYSELAERMRRLADRLVASAVQQGEIVGLYMGQGIDSIVAMLSVLSLGGVFVNMDPSLPLGRLSEMIDQCCPVALVTTNDRTAQAKRLVGDRRIRLLSTDGDESAPACRCSVANYGNYSWPAYIFFTSGSTGRPKGILGTANGLAHFLRWQSQAFGLVTEDRVAQMTGVGFDVYLRDVFSVLMSGGSVHVPPEAVQQDTHRWINWLNAERVTVLHTVPSLLASRLADSEPTEMVRTVRLVFFAGEILTAFLVDRARRLFPLARFVNLYGPTETTLAKCWHEIKDIESPIVPVGRPIPGAQVTILNPSGAVCWPGEVGEIYIRTPYRTLGEVRPSGALDSIFVQNPCENDPEDLVFRTGDLGRYRLDGSVEVLGRCDNQVKRNGVRLDLSELESSICGFEGISQCVVLYETVEGGSLDAYVMCSNPDISLQGLRQFLLERLSTAMLPNRFYSVEAIPLLNNGKVDRRALRSIKGALLESDSSQNLPLDTPLQLVMGLAWESITGKPCTSLADDFFALGGDSLMAMRLVSRLRELLQLDLSIAEVFDHPTLGSLCEHVLQCDDSDRTAKVAGIVLSVFAPVSSELASQPNATPEPGVRSLASVSGRFVSRSPSISPCTQLDRE